MKEIVLPFAAAFACGLLIGAGVGGGTLLIFYLSMIAKMPLHQARGLNLLYFLVCAPAALYGHFKNRLIELKTASAAALAGCLSAALCALFSGGLPKETLQKAFGVLFIAVGALELFSKSKSKEPK